MDLIEQLDRELELDQERRHSKRLGASGIGTECPRALWYSFRWSRTPGHIGRMLRLFDRGNREEQVVYDLLEKLGLTVRLKQSQYTMLHAHSVAIIDGVVSGNLLPENMILSIKTHNDNNFKRLKKKGVRSEFFTHYAQSQIEMYLAGYTKTLYFAVNKNDDHIYVKIINRDECTIVELVDKAKEVIFNYEAPERIRPNSAYMPCKFCNYRKICWGQEIPLPNCRTCRFSKPLHEVADVNLNSSESVYGKWHCEKDHPEIADQKGCKDHVYNSHMLQEFNIVEEMEDYNIYSHFETGELKQGPQYKTSNELYEENKC